MLKGVSTEQRAERFPDADQARPLKIAVIGLGYVGLEAAIAFAGSGTSVIGFDIDPNRITQLQNKRDKNLQVSAESLATPKITFSNAPRDLSAANFYIITVPTPLTDDNRPDLAPLQNAAVTVGRVLNSGDTVVLESTVYPGVTETVVASLLETTSGLRVGVDFGLGYSPERINPGDQSHTFETVIKVVSATDAPTLERVATVYERAVRAGVFRAASIQVAEAAKLIENIQRDCAISLMNELCQLFRKTGLDTYDVLRTAATKWNFIPVVPGLVGGHCIGIDPYYLIDWAEQNAYVPQIIPSARRVNQSMSDFIAHETLRLLDSLPAPRVAIAGVTFKEDVPDIRNSQILTLIHTLQAKQCVILLHDPIADKDEIEKHWALSLSPLEELRDCDAIVLAVAHGFYRDLGWELIRPLLRADRPLVVVDVKAFLDRESIPERVILWRP